MDDAVVDLRKLISLLRRQLRLIVTVVVCVVGLAAVVVFSIPPKYSASALVLVDSSEKNLLTPDSNSGLSQIDDARIQSEMEIVRAPTILLRVISDHGLLRDAEFGVHLGLRERVLAFLQIAQPTLPTGEAALQRVLDNLERATSVSRSPRTNLLMLTVTSLDPAKAAELANAWAKSYIQDQIEAKVSGTLLSRDVLQARMEQARSSIVDAEGAFDSFLDSNLSQIVKETGRSDIAGLRDNLTSLTAERTATAKRIELAQAGLARQDWATLTQSLQSEAMRELERQRSELSTRVASVSSDTAVNLRAELAKVEQRLVDTASGELASLRKTVADGQAEESDLRQRIRTTVLGSSLSPDVLARIYELQQNSELARTQYQRLLARIQDLDAQASLQIADSRVVSSALAPDRPSSPNVGAIIAIALMSAILLALVLAFLRENIVGGFMTEEQAAAVLHIPVVAALPRERSTAEGSIADQMITSMMAPFPEGIRRIKVAIDQVNHRRNLDRADRGPPDALVIMVTSSTANEGKSTTALALARSFATAKRSVLLIDADLRLPSIHTMIGREPSPTILGFLGGEHDDFATLVDSDPFSDARVILGARPTDVPSDHFVAGRHFSRLLERARSMFDIVILDTSPIGPVVDGLYVAPLADVVLLVVKAASTTQTEARATVGALRNASAQGASLFAVLNQQDRASASYKNRYTSYYQTGLP
jgi:succinoglycan biosynthesis transport protein ExoP